MCDVEGEQLELGGLSGSPLPPKPEKCDAQLMAPGDVVLLDMNGEKWAFVNLKANQ
jgi:tRNA (adenine-N(1)-)-methyltransferase non-catalytic subunit